MGKDFGPGPQEKRFAAYMDGLAQAAGHADRATPLKMYCAGLLLPGERKSVEPIGKGTRLGCGGFCGVAHAGGKVEAISGYPL